MRSSVCFLLLVCLAVVAPIVAVRADPPHPTPQALACGLQLWCTPESPCIAGQATRSNEYALVTFDISSLMINRTANPNATDYVAYDDTNTYYASVCGVTKTICPAPYNTPNDYGIVAETTNPNVCYPVAHEMASNGWNLVDPLDVTAGVQVRYVDGEYSGCPDGSASPRQVNYIFQCGEDTPSNPFASAGLWENTQCNFTFVFQSKAACPTIDYYIVEKAPGLSGGSVFLIILACVIFVYVVATMSFNYWRGARTWQTLRPHPAFWIAFASYVAIGVRVSILFVRTRCNKSAAAEERQDRYQDIHSGEAARPLPSPTAEADLYEETPPPAEKINYAAHFSSDRDDVGVGIHAPLTLAQNAKTYDAFGN